VWRFFAALQGLEKRLLCLAHRDGGQRRVTTKRLGARIERIHGDSGGRYGSPRVHEVLRREGIRCSNKRVARLMRERGLRGRVSRLYRRSPALHKFFAKTGNLRLDEPLPTRPDQIWVGDLTYLRLASVGVTSRP